MKEQKRKKKRKRGDSHLTITDEDAGGKRSFVSAEGRVRKGKQKKRKEKEREEREGEEKGRRWVGSFFGIFICFGGGGVFP